MRVSYRVDGPEQAMAIVFGNSLCATTQMWDAQMEPLVDKGFRVIRYDLRGHGDSPAPQGPCTIAELGGDVLELLDGLDVERAHFVGLSIGAMIGMWLGAHAGERIDRLVLCCTSARPGAPEAWRGRLDAARDNGMEWFADGLLERWFTPQWRAADPVRLARMRTMITATTLEGYLGCGDPLVGLDLTGELGRITAPTLVVAGAGDAAFGPGHAATIAEGIPGARTEIVADAAHLANVEQPERCTELLLEHLA
ncbi:3-oxoadipate enol-lactonase [Sciscionella marina]|uniref:3-oxoadipate enol-lactonase n=1 Tax=Sciscionella marina TaxID=508770 RepID=UPI00036A6C4D|nr:3-oxoadipate enol-lactonase [Sciscionella marina]